MCTYELMFIVHVLVILLFTYITMSHIDIMYYSHITILQVIPLRKGSVTCIIIIIYYYHVVVIIYLFII